MATSKNATVKTMYCWAEKLFLGFFALYLLKSTQYTTTFNLSPFVPEWADQFLLVSLSVTTILKLLLLLLSDLQEKTKWLCLIFAASIVSLIWFLVYLNDRFIFLAYLSILLLGCIGTDYRTLLKVQVCVVGAVVFSAALCCIGGAIENKIYWGHETVRSAFGFTYPTDMAAYYMFLIISAWIAWDEVWDLLFLLPGALSLFVSGVIADSNTSFFCSGIYCLIVLWCWIVRSKRENHIVLCIERILELICKTAFPLCAIIAIMLTIAFHEGIPFALKVNEWTSTRLALQSEAFYENGIHLLGYPFAMRGYTSSLPTLNYNYVDCSYLQLLLRYGILIFFLYMLLWPLMTEAAIKAGKYRLSLGLALIALHSLSEQRFIFVDYNPLLVAPFPVLSLRYLQKIEKKDALSREGRSSRLHYITLATITLFIVPVLLFWKPLLSGFRTLWTVLLSPNLTLQLYQRRVIFFASISFLVVCILLLFVIYHIITAVLTRKKLNKRYIVILLLSLTAGSVLLVKGNMRLDRAMEEYAVCLEEDSDVITLAQKVDGIKLYEVELPTLYNRKYGNISTNFFNGEDLARFHQLAVITNSDNQWSAMFQSGFSYAEISAEHAIYTDSMSLIEALKKAGYNPVSYYSKEMAVNMDNLAEWNKLKINPNGSMIISSDHPILNVPDLDLQAGRYTFCFDLTMIPSSMEMTELEDSNTAFTLHFSDNSGERTLFEQSVPFSQFDENGNLKLHITADFHAKGVEFAIIPVSGCCLELHGVNYRITP